ncbi:hypothetical protein TSMEX_010136 [Taenia solium]|eukprot:TsM_000148000 transcript=TsM_000148000 gene=TsM_000148000
MICRFFVLLLVHPSTPTSLHIIPSKLPTLTYLLTYAFVSSHVISQDFPCPRVHKTSYTIKYYTYIPCRFLTINHIIPVFCVHTHPCSSRTPNQQSHLTSSSATLTPRLGTATNEIGLNWERKEGRAGRVANNTVMAFLILKSTRL